MDVDISCYRARVGLFFFTKLKSKPMLIFLEVTCINILLSHGINSLPIVVFMLTTLNLNQYHFDDTIGNSVPHPSNAYTNRYIPCRHKQSPDIPSVNSVFLFLIFALRGYRTKPRTFSRAILLFQLFCPERF